jgi:hypothetical protein
MLAQNNLAYEALAHNQLQTPLIYEPRVIDDKGRHRGSVPRSAVSATPRRLERQEDAGLVTSNHQRLVNSEAFRIRNRT